MGDEVTLQVFEGTEGIPTNAEVVFLGKSPTLKVSDQLAGRFIKNFAKFTGNEAGKALVAAGPKL